MSGFATALQERSLGLKSKIKRFIQNRLYGIKLMPAAHSHPLHRLGSAHGGWTFVDTDQLQGATIISCGLGEDASFDVEFAARYGARVIIVDPTPRAVAHFGKIAAHIGQAASSTYADGGSQPIESYDLLKLNSSSLALVEKALWREETTLKFFAPPDPSHVSHSISNFRNQFRNDTQHVEVQTVTFDTLLQQFGLRRVPLLKIDIEGAEVEVLQDMLTRRIFPDQILVEYDELIYLSRRTRQRIGTTHDMLLQNGYRLLHFAAPNNCLYFRN